MSGWVVAKSILVVLPPLWSTGILISESLASDQKATVKVSYSSSHLHSMHFAVFPFTGIQDLHVGNSMVFAGDHIIHAWQLPDKYGESQVWLSTRCVRSQVLGLCNIAQVSVLGLRCFPTSVVCLWHLNKVTCDKPRPVPVLPLLSASARVITYWLISSCCARARSLSPLSPLPYAIMMSTESWQQQQHPSRRRNHATMLSMIQHHGRRAPHPPITTLLSLWWL